MWKKKSSSKLIAFVIILSLMLSGCFFFSSEEVSAASHTHTYKLVKTKQSTCAKKGYKLYKCKKCDKTKKTYLKKKDHSLKLYKTKKTTEKCSTTTTKYYKCKKCSYKLTKWNTSYDHTYKVTKKVQPTYSTNGCIYYKCKTCGYSRTQTLKNLSSRLTAVPSGGTVTLNKAAFEIETITAPEENTFGEYYEKAKAVYDAVLDGDSYIILEQDSSDKEKEFYNSVRREMLDYGYTLSRTIYSNEPLQYKYDISDISADYAKELLARDYVYKACTSAGIKTGMTKKEAVVRMDCWICSHLSYKVNEKDYYDAFLAGEGKCYAYARMFGKMCEICDIQEQKVMNSSGTHMWNKVKFGSTWYHVDVCWCDTGGDIGEYLLSKNIWSNHKY